MVGEWCPRRPALAGWGVGLPPFPHPAGAGRFRAKIRAGGLTKLFLGAYVFSVSAFVYPSDAE